MESYFFFEFLTFKLIILFERIFFFFFYRFSDPK